MTIAELNTRFYRRLAELGIRAPIGEAGPPPEKRESAVAA